MSDGSGCGWVPAGDRFTAADLGKLPWALVCELVDGVLVAAPHGGAAQQAVVLELGFLLRRNSTAQFQVMVSPQYQPTPRTVLQPDALVCHAGQISSGPVNSAVQLVVEVTSDVTRTIDQTLKKTLYETAGIPAYWLVDPEARTLTVRELAQGKYNDPVVINPTETYETAKPFPLTVVPSDLFPKPQPRV
ncbi:Uma2 family endonuclease [Kribbella sp. NPDC051770]|uniref:Uma2 family endonuclease n=1 Tax=Kribbella sp. NPDC051770 TaxID=3155413 RepID=UPI00343898A0